MRRAFATPELETDHQPVLDHGYDTPHFLISPKRVGEKIAEYEACFPGASIHYAMKANAEAKVLTAVHEAGAGFEAASLYELHALEALRVAPDQIIYGSSVKPVGHIRTFWEYGVDRFAVDCPSEIQKVASVAPGARIYVRVAVDDTGSVFRFSEKFGADKVSVVPLLQNANALGLIPYGISFHVGSQASNPCAWANAIDALGPIMGQLVELGIEIEALNLGGGFPCQYASTEARIALDEIAKETLNAYGNLPYQPRLILEPGRDLVAESASAVATVIGRADRREHSWLFLDLGVYNGLFEAMAYQGSTRYRVTSARPSYSAGEAMFALAGPTGDSPDVITREALLPRDIEIGDRLIFHDVGAYSLVTTCSFNGFPKPAIYYA